MLAQKDSHDRRTIRISGLNEKFLAGLPLKVEDTFELTLSYTGPGDCDKGLVLDYLIVPLVIDALNERAKSEQALLVNEECKRESNPGSGVVSKQEQCPFEYVAPVIKEVYQKGCTCHNLLIPICPVHC